MQVQRISNNNYNTTFGEKLIFDTKLITRATREEKSELAHIKRLFKNRGINGNIKVKNDRKITVKELINDLYTKFNQSNSKRTKLK